MQDSEFYEKLVDYKGGEPEPLHETTAVLAYEVGRMLEQAMYMFWQSGDELGLKIRRGFYKSELIDAIAQLVLITEYLGENFDELKAMGIEKAVERFTGKERKTVGVKSGLR